MIEEALTEARRLAHENRLEGKDLDELDELEDDEDADFLDSYRQKRFQELSTIQIASVYGQVYPLTKPEWSKEVTEESSKAWVLVLLTSSSGTNTESQLMIEIWRELARKFGDVKFGQIRGDLCIEGYPDRNTPTILVYKDGDIRRQIVTLRELKGSGTRADDVEWMLVELGAVKREDPRLRKKEGDGDAMGGSKANGGLRQSSRAKDDDDDDSDWD
jgi:hypothetical protein